MTTAHTPDSFAWLAARIAEIQRQLVGEREQTTKSERRFSQSIDALSLAVIEVLDLVERLQAEPDSGPYLRKIGKKLDAVLKSAGVDSLEVTHVAPGLTRVLDTRTQPGTANGTVLEVCRKGYKMREGGRVLRPAEIISCRNE